ncbi:MAG: SEC-C metal-binding domain-containing protein [Clostridium sp.]
MRENIYGLIELLKMKEIKELHILAQLYKFRGYSGYKKEELAEKLAEVIQKEALQYLATLNEKDLALFEGLAEEVTLVDGRLGRAALFISLGWATRVRDEDVTYLVIAREIKALYDKGKQDASFQELRTHRQNFRTYRNGLTNLYGAVELYWVEHLYNRDYGREVNFAVMLKDLNYMNQIYGGCKLMGDYLVHASLYCEGEEDFLKLKKEVGQKNYYEPSKLLITLMSQEGYYEELEETKKLKEYLKKHVIANENFIEEAIVTLVLSVRSQHTSGLDLMEDVMQQWYRLGIHIQNMDQLQEVTLMMTQIMKHTRSWYNKGYTSEEVQREMFPEMYGKEVTQVNKVKVGRNDACPCGSGKKYKKCCI